MSDIKSTEELRHHLKEKLAEYLGVEIDDISEEDLISEDLHMSPTELTDFIETIRSSYPNIAVSDLFEVESVGELIDEVTSQHEVI